ncbi:MAG: alcohol dehydrogenase catalytic domain-containing protein [Proteobacteria bacterium]|nr:alcohol dehydrogenase catalytic domain-containing protein [Pseudomonadota bacterium]
MLLNAPFKLSPGDVDDAVAGDGETLVRVTHSGVCGTDLKIYNGSIPVEYPRIMGHELIGEIANVGAAIGVDVGTRVIVDPVVNCGDCEDCRTGHENLCRNGSLLGRDRDGGFSDLMAVPAEAIIALPSSISNESAPLVQVMTTCEHAQQRARVTSGESVVVIGLGVSGQLHIQLAKARGAHPIIGITGSPVRREMAQQYGADYTLAAGNNAADEVHKLTGGRGVDLVIDCAGAASTLAQSIDIARPGGRLLLFGIYTFREAALPFYQLYYKELTIINSRAATRADFQTCIDLVCNGHVELDAMISDVLPLTDLEKAITMLDQRDDHRMKVTLNHT